MCKETDTTPRRSQGKKVFIDSVQDAFDVINKIQQQKHFLYEKVICGEGREKGSEQI